MPWIAVEEVVVVIVEAHRQALQDRRGQFGRRAAPLLFGVALEEGLVEIRADEAQRLFLEGLRIGDRGIGLAFEKGARLVRAQGLAEELVDRVQVDRQRDRPGPRRSSSPGSCRAGRSRSGSHSPRPRHRRCGRCAGHRHAPSRRCRRRARCGSCRRCGRAHRPRSRGARPRPAPARSRRPDRPAPTIRQCLVLGSVMGKCSAEVAPAPLAARTPL